LSHEDEDEDAETLPPGTVLGRYQLLRLLGRGGMGAVYEGIHLDLKKRVAIKTLRPALAAMPGARARFLREGEAASRIAHRNVVDVTDVGTSDGVTYLVMELLEGQDLSDRLAQTGALSVADTMDVLLPVVAAIGVAHDEGVIHRDLKPENIFLARTRHAGVEPKVLDFGISKISSRGSGNTLALTGTGASMGTPYYMAPEQIRSAAGADARSDQYALGSILYQCVTGRRAHEGATVYEVIRSVGDGSFPPPRAVRPDLPAALEQVIVRAMSLDPALRFPSVRALGHALLPFATPATRAQWTPELSPPDAETAVAGGGAPQPGGTVLLPPPAIAVRPSQPRAESPRATTLGASAAQIAMPPARRRTAALLPVLLVVAGGAVGGYLFFQSSPKPAAPRTAVAPASRPLDVTPPPLREPPRYHVSVASRPPEAEFELDGKLVGSGSYAGDLAADGVAHTLKVSAAGYLPATLNFRDRPPPEEVTLQVRPAPAERPAPPAVEASAPVHTPRPAGHGHGHTPVAQEPEPARPAAPAPKPPAGPIRTENNAAIIED
jgi:eukaryotic-like serine/threonine-protein kinase